MNKKLIYAAFLIIGILTIPIFFETYRSLAFNTIAHDPYDYYLLRLVGQGTYTPTAPFIYRFFSVAIAIPFYHILPYYSFNGVPNNNHAYLKVAEALSFVSYLSIVLSAVMIFKIARKHYFATINAAIIVALLSLLACSFVSKIGIDPFAVLMICLLCFWIKNPALFIPLILFSAGANEKIAIIFSIILSARVFESLHQDRKMTLMPQLAAAYVSVVLYSVIRGFVKASGYENQTTPSLFMGNIHNTIISTMTTKGIFLNVIPVIFVLLLIWLCISFRKENGFKIADTAGFFILAILCYVTDVQLNVGRIIMYTYPLYLPAATAFIDYLQKLDSQKKTGLHPDIATSFSKNPND